MALLFRACGCALCLGVKEQEGPSGQKQTVLANPHSGDYRIDVLFNNPTDKWFPDRPVGTAASLTFSFAAAPGYWTGGDARGFLAFNDAQKVATRDVFTRLSQEFNLTFAEVDEASGDVGQIRFGNNSQGTTSAGYAFFPNHDPRLGGDVFMNVDTAATTDPAQNVRGTDVYATIVHEILHALGINHPGNYNAGEPANPAARGNFLIETEDHTANTVMSYFNQLGGQGQQREFLGSYDVLALGYAYGRKAVRTANDVYDLTDADGIILRLISDGGGVDTLNASGLGQGAILNLMPGAASSVGVAANGQAARSNLSTSFDTLIENVIGTGFADTMTGNAARNIITPGAGNDTVNGGDGLDTVVIAATRAQAQVQRSDATLTVNHGSELDTLVSVERVRFSDVTIAFDLEGNAGQAYRLYQAAFARTPDLGGLSFWTNRIDGGADLIGVASGFVASTEFRTVYGANPTNTDIVGKFYQNVLNRAGEPGGVNFWVGELNSGSRTVSQVLAGFSESAENKQLVGVAIANGITLDNGVFV